MTHRLIRLIGLFFLAVLLIAPLFASDFVLRQIGVRTFYLAILGMSLVFLAGYGGMVSLAQVALYGVGSYTYAYLVVSNEFSVAVGILGALVMPIIVGVLFALVSVRTEGIYFLMITLALAMLTFNFALQNRSITRGFSGIVGVTTPTLLSLPLSNPVVFYYVSLGLALAVYFAFRYLVRTPFGLALQGIRDNPRRMASLGYSVQLHRIAAFSLSAFAAGLSGLLGVWFNGQVSPGAIDLNRNINVLLIVVLGGFLYFEGAWIGALFFVVVSTYAINFTVRFNTLIGVAFLAVALLLPQGITGLFHRFVFYLGRRLFDPQANAPVKKKIVE